MKKLSFIDYNNNYHLQGTRIIMSSPTVALSLLLLLSTQLLADETKKSTLSQEYLHSPREAIDNVTKLGQKKVSGVDNLKHMFSDAKVNGQIKSIYAGYNYKKETLQDIYATAIGGMLKYELASLHGFNAAVSVYTAHDINFLTGENGHINHELSSENGYYTEMAEAYFNYTYKDLNLRVGRQVLNTPLADSDDVRVIQNSFDAYVATYHLNDIELMVGNIQRWQGFDAGLEDFWSKTGTDGTNFIGLIYSDMTELDIWYYNITGITNAFYIDGGFNYPFSKDITLHAMVQYLQEEELKSSGVESTIYGTLVECIIYDIGLNISYNRALQKLDKKSFAGFGGGTLFTSMDTITLDLLAQDENAQAIATGLTYNYKKFQFLYAYGDFSSDSKHIAEQDITAQYNINDEFLVATIYSIESDLKQQQKTDDDWNRLQILINYNF